MALIFKSIYYVRKEIWDDFSLVLENGDLPYHYSIRPGAKPGDPLSVVLNTQINGAWGKEIEFNFDLLGQPAAIFTSIIHEAQSHLLINGVLVHVLPSGLRADAAFSVKTWMNYRQSELIFGAGQIAPGGVVVRVEMAEPAKLHGYVVLGAPPPETRSLGKKNIVVWAGSQAFPCVATLSDRPELAGLAGPDVDVLGFVVDIGAEPRSKIQAALESRRRPFPIRLDWAGAGSGTTWINPTGAIDSFENFRIDGWISGNAQMAKSLELRANGKKIPATFNLGDPRPIQEDCQLAPTARTGFYLTLPPAAWQHAQTGDALDLEIYCDDVRLLGADICLSRAQAAGWIARLAALPTSPVPLPDQLDHVTLGKLLPLLTPEIQTSFTALNQERGGAPQPETPAPKPVSRAPGKPAILPPPNSWRFLCHSPRADGALIDVFQIDIPADPRTDPSLDFVASPGNIPMHLKARRKDNLLIFNSMANGAWGPELVLGALPSSWQHLVIELELSGETATVAVNHTPWITLPSQHLSFDALDIQGVRSHFVRRGPMRRAPDPAQTPAGTTRRIAAPTHPPAIVKSVDGFVVQGEFRTRDQSPPLIELWAESRPLDAPVICWLEPAESAAAKPATHRYQFEIEIPGTIWASHANGQPLPLELRINGTAVEPFGMVLTQDHALEVFSRTAHENIHSPDHQQRVLRAIEHIGYGGFLALLPPEDAAHFWRFAETTRLTEFLRSPPAAKSASTETPKVQAPTPTPEISRESMDRILVLRAMRELDRRVTGTEDPIFPHIKTIIAEWDLTGPRLEEFCVGLVANLCLTNELAKLAEIIPLSRFFAFEQRADAWALTTACAIFVADRQINRAADVLYKMASRPQGWIHTACVAYAAREVEAMAATRALPEQEVQRFRYAVLAVFDAMKGDWFSRLHDRQLIETIVTLLGRCHLFPDYLSNDLARAALKHYSLSPSFWDLWSQAIAGNDTAIHPLLLRARDHFNKLSAGIASPAQADTSLRAICQALQFFHAHRNPESLHWMREIAANALRAESQAAPADVVNLLTAILSAEESDVVRLAAMPNAPDATDQLSQITTLDLIPRMLRGMHLKSASSSFYSQIEACRLLASGAIDKNPAAANALLLLANTLSVPRANYAGAELLAILASQAGRRKTSINRDAVLRRFGDLLNQFLATETNYKFLPASFVTALSRLRQIQHTAKDPFLNTLLQTLDRAIAARFGDLHDAALSLLPATAAHPAIKFNDAILGGDTLVVVYSCNAYLDSRIPMIRETWMRDLQARGIPCIVMVGGGDDTLEGDVLRLRVSDAYDDLPAKTLALVKWVLTHTNAHYLIKIDDDCYLNADNYFNSLEYRLHHYYGRVLQRKIGDMDRTWHHKKSHPGELKRIDLSPEPSTYADGGGVYCLSRFAMTQLIEQLSTREGQRLIAHSFMEDKLVGDLLAQAGIAPSNLEYGSYQRRRTFGAAIPVGMWEDTFFPSELSPSKVAHLDLAADQSRAQLASKLRELNPKKLWPSTQKVTIELNAPQLELVSDAGALAQALKHPIGVICAARNEITILPHFLAHYRALGVNSFFFIDNLSDDGTREYLLQQPDVVLYSSSQEYRLSHYGVTWQHTVLAHHFLGRWAVVADTDEFLIYPGWKNKPLAALIAEAESQGADALSLHMVDMYPYGSLDDADFAQRSPFDAAPWFDRDQVTPFRLGNCYYSNRVQLVSALRHRLMPDSEPANFVAEKIALFKYQPWLRVSEGLHGAANVKLSSLPANFAHFKYHKGFRQKILDEIARNQHYDNAIEYKRYASMITESFGGFGVPGVSVRLGPDGFTPMDAEPE